MSAGGGVVVVRAAEEVDAQAVVAHRRRLAMASPFILTEPGDVPDVEKQRSQIAERRERAGDLMLVAVLGEESGAAGGGRMVVGTLGFSAGHRRKIAHQGSFGLGLDAEWRGRGVGRALIEAMLDWAAAHPVIEKVQLGVFTTNERARRLYERMGFVEEARQVRFVKEGPGQYVDDVMMCIFVKEGVAPEGFRTWRSGQVRCSR